MRKTMLVSVGLLTSILIQAQLKKGNKMVGVSVGTILYNHSNTDLSTAINTSSTGADNFTVTVDPSAGWFITDNTAIGVMPTISYHKQKILGKSASGSTFLKDESNQYSFGAGGFIRHYFNLMQSDAVRFFGQYDISIGIGGSKTEGFQYESFGVYVDRYNRKSSGDLFAKTGLSVGISKFLNKHTALDFYAGYRFSYTRSNPKGSFIRDYADPSTGDITQNIDYDQKYTDHNAVFGVGLQIFLERKQ